MIGTVWRSLFDRHSVEIAAEGIGMRGSFENNNKDKPKLFRGKCYYRFIHTLSLGEEGYILYTFGQQNQALSYNCNGRGGGEEFQCSSPTFCIKYCTIN